MCKCQVRKLNMLIDKFLKLSAKTLYYPTLWSNNFIPHDLLVKLEYPYMYFNILYFHLSVESFFGCVGIYKEK